MFSFLFSEILISKNYNALLIYYTKYIYIIYIEDVRICTDFCTDGMYGNVRIVFKNLVATLYLQFRFIITIFKVTYTENMPKALKLFSDFLGTKSWLVGENITYPDFHMYEMLDQHKMFKADCLKEFSNLEAYCDR